MIAYYLDASAFSKRFLKEPGSEWVNQEMQFVTTVLLASSELLSVEVVSAVARAHREKRISLHRRNSVVEQVREEVASFLQIVQVTQPILKSASALTLTYGLRAYDAIHLATAIQVRNRFVQLAFPAPIFVSADIELLAAAKSEGFATENPNDHP